ncbi:MAG TPA: Uma2 family endonuclease [Allosphingosinicella sp.]|nr:Uma2 family endonuclease [Allosphingosinicella sp.]
MADSGAFANHARTELLEGEIWVVNSVHRWHARTLATLTRELARAIEAVGLPLEVLAAGSVSMSEDSVPEPDLSVIAPIHGEADTIALEELKIAIEVADSTAELDLGRKTKLYARHGVPEYWVVHRERRVVVQMWSPADGDYLQRRDVPFGATIAAATINGLAAETASIT